MNKIAVALIAVALLLLIFGCSEPQKGFGSVEGYVYSPNGESPLFGVKVTVADDQNILTFTDINGYFLIPLIPIGEKKLIFEQGSFRNEVDVIVKNTSTSVLNGTDSIKISQGAGAKIVKMAVVKGSFDSIEKVLADLGFKELKSPEEEGTGYVVYNTPKEIIEDWETLSKYDILFMNCGTSDYNYDSNYGPINDYNYGKEYDYNYDSIYDTNYDWGADYNYDNWEDYNYDSIYDNNYYNYYDYNYYDYNYLNDSNYPYMNDSVDYNYDNLEKFVKNGGSLYASDWEYYPIKQLFKERITFHDPAKIGAVQDITAQIINDDLKKYFGKDTINIRFDLGAWVLIDSVDDNKNILIAGNVTTEGKQSLVDEPLMVIIQHGLGRVLYTSFHNEVQVTDDVEKIIKKIIFEL